MKEIQRVLVSEVTWKRNELAVFAHSRDLTHLRDIEVPDDTEGERPGTFALYHGYDGRLSVFRIDQNEEGGT